MVGLSKEELAQTPFLSLIHPEYRTMVIETHTKRLNGVKLPFTDSIRVRNRSCQELWVEINTVLICWDGKFATLNFLRDITEKKKLQEQRREQADTGYGLCMNH